MNGLVPLGPLGLTPVIFVWDYWGCLPHGYAPVNQTALMVLTSSTLDSNERNKHEPTTRACRQMMGFGINLFARASKLKHLPLRIDFRVTKQGTKADATGQLDQPPCKVD